MDSPRDVICSPFGERFHFRTRLTLAECKSRIDSIASASLFESNFTEQPVSARRRNRFWLWENKPGVPPELTGRLESKASWTEIVGTGGANLLSFWAALFTFILIVALGAYNTIYEAGSIPIWRLAIASIIGPLFMYWRFWDSPHAGSLIDYLQNLLECEIIRGRVGDPIARN